MSAYGGVAARGRALAAVICGLSIALLSACSPSQPTTGTAGVTYSCCSASVVNTTWHPGQQMRVPWIVQGKASDHQSAVTLTVVLAGPYRTVTALKAANQNGLDSARVIATAPRIKVAGTATSPPVSVVGIPGNAAPGYYNLTFGVGAEGFTSGGSSIIKIV